MLQNILKKRYWSKVINQAILETKSTTLRWDAMRNLVPFAQFKKHEKHPWRSVTFAFKLQASAYYYTIRTLLHGCFSRF